jgi:HlyD family secretion protein
MAIAPYRRTSLLGICAGIVALIAVAFFGIRSFTREAVEVRTAPVTYQDLISTVSTNGKVQPVHEFQAHAPYPGVVSNIYVHLGERVNAGTLLLRMSDADARARLAAASSNLTFARRDEADMAQGGSLAERNQYAMDIAAAKSELQLAQKNLDVTQMLQQKGAASASEVAAAQQRVITAQNALQNAQIRANNRYSPTDLGTLKARVADAAANLNAAETGLANADIRSPWPGTVYSIPVSQYDFVPAGDDLLDLADLNHVKVFAYFDEPEIGKLAKGQAVKITWDAKPNQTWHGHIETPPSTVIPYGTRSVGECIITVDDAKGDLPPNSNVTVIVTTSERFNVLSIPREALHSEGVNNFVFRLDGNKLVRTTVRIDPAAVNLTRVQVLSGLTEKDTVVLNAINNSELTNGLAVKPVE